MIIRNHSVPGQRQGKAVKQLKTTLVVVVFTCVLSGLIGIAEWALAASVVVDSDGAWLRLADQSGEGPKPKLILYTTMATWCAACKTELPQFKYLRKVFTPEELGMFGLPYDDKDESAQLKAWVAANGPPYDLFTDLTKGNIASIKAMVMKTLRLDGVPATIVTDGNGTVLRMRWGPPSVSELRELLLTQKELVQH